MLDEFPFNFTGFRICTMSGTLSCLDGNAEEDIN